VLEAAVVFRSDADEPAGPVALYFCAKDIQSPQMTRELETFVLDRRPVHKRPRWIEFLPKLPKTVPGRLSAASCVWLMAVPEVEQYSLRPSMTMI
jgi:acyl-coenzyme A synthetase/AMP-(fatty) acid ligase